MRQPEYAFTGDHPKGGGFVGFVNIRKTDDGARVAFSVRCEGENPTQAVYEIPTDQAIALLDGALKGLKGQMDDAQIKHMVDRFLSWRLPENFRPDAGISFKPEFNEHTPHPMRHEPLGTNLFDATQAEAMVRHMVGGAADAPR